MSLLGGKRRDAGKDGADSKSEEEEEEEEGTNLRKSCRPIHSEEPHGSIRLPATWHHGSLALASSLRNPG